jgi:hypothetical protein
MSKALMSKALMSKALTILTEGINKLNNNSTELYSKLINPSLIGKAFKKSACV